MAEYRLLATDLDGTLIGSANEFPLYANLKERLDKIKASNNVTWVACTGRRLVSFKHFFGPMRMMGIKPEYVIVNHAFIYGWTRFGYLPHVFWNLMTRYRLWVDQIHMREAIDDWHEMITGVSLGVSTVRRRKNRLCLRFDSEESAIVAADLLKEKVKSFNHLRVFRYLMEVDVRSVPFTKGLAVAELASHLGVGAEEILAIGNGHNDISMLDGNVAKFVGCPSNSEMEVMEVVHKVGGHIAKSRSLAGVLEILDAFESDAVCSDLPEGWEPHTPGYSSKSNKSSSHSSRKKRRVLSAITFLGVSYTVLLVFAHFGLVPFFSEIIVKPFKWFVGVIEKIILAF